MIRRPPRSTQAHTLFPYTRSSDLACRMIREEVPRALKRAHVPFTLRAPVTLEVDFAMTIYADMAELCPGATRTAGRTVAFTHPEYGEVFRAWRALLNLSAVV